MLKSTRHKLARVFECKNAAAEKVQDPDTIDYHVKSSVKARFSCLWYTYSGRMAQPVKRGSAGKARHDTDAGSILRCGKGFLSQRSQPSVQTLSRCPYSPRMRSYASTAVLTFKIPNTGSHSRMDWLQGNTAHVGRNWGAALLLRLL